LRAAVYPRVVTVDPTGVVEMTMAVVAVALGVVATARDLAVAVDLGAGTITIMSIVTLILAIVTRADVPKINRTR
jgi:hypothetical protein